MNISEHTYEIINQVSRQMQKIEPIKALWLSGSYGRGEADAFSDFDFNCVILDNQKIGSVFNVLKNTFTGDGNIIFSKALPGLNTLNLIDSEWTRIDITLIQHKELQYLYVKNFVFLYDYVDAKNVMQQVSPPKKSLLNDFAEVESGTNEFIRILGLLPIALGRDDEVLAQMGSTLLRDILVKTMQRESSDGVVRGMLSLKKMMHSEHYDALRKAPVLSANRNDIIAYNQYLAEIFVPLSQKQYAERNMAWPHEFYEFTRKQLNVKIGIELGNSSL